MRKEPFFGKQIDVDADAEVINKLLEKHRGEEANVDLKNKIYKELSAAKELGKISTPFKVILREGATEAHRPLVEVLLDTKV